MCYVKKYIGGSMTNDDIFFEQRQFLGKIIYHNVGKADLLVLHSIMFGEDLCDLIVDKQFTINQTKLAKKLRKDQGNISKSLKRLIKAELIKKIEGTDLYTFDM